ncbi:MAG: ABC transporter ATP-binding protein [bacterium]|nr:ABC transporter ATP-binding protein [bacterium]
MTPRQRVFAYVRQEKGRYILGAALTLAYAFAFQLVPLAMREVVGRIEAGRSLAEVQAAAFVLMGIATVFAVLRFGTRRTMFRAGRQIEYGLRNDLFSHLQKLPQSYFAGQRTGDLMSRAVNDVNNVRLFMGMGILNIIQTPILYLGAIGVMLSVDWQLALWVLAPYPLFVFITRFFGKRMHLWSLATQEQLGVLSSGVQENAAGVFVVRSAAMEDRERARFALDNDSLYQKQVRFAFVSTGMFTTISMLPSVAQIAVLVGGSYGVIGGRVTTADLWLFYSYAVLLTFPTFLMGFVVNIAMRALAGLERLGEILDTVPSIQDGKETLDLTHLRGSVEVRKLSYEFKGREDHPALSDVSFSVEAGQTVGIVGAVGSGKSTLLAAIPRLLEVEDGNVLIDGHDVNRIPLNLLRSSIAMVPQDSFLFSTTIEENIRFGCPDADREAVRRAARRAHVLGDIEDFPQGFDTPVGERGITLSGGQRQRIALARALALDPPILILDDSLSSVDAATEEAILKELRSARSGRSCFIVAHRTSAVRDADFIIVLDEGRVAEVGTHEYLLRNPGVYERIYRQQQLEAEIEGGVA